MVNIQKSTGLFKVESYRKGIVISTVFNVLNKGLIFVNGLAIVYFFGSGMQSDLFFYLYNSVLILGAFFTSVNSSVLIPESMRIRENNGKAHSMAFLNFFLLLYSLFAALGMVAALIDPAKLFATLSNFTNADLYHNRHLLILSLPLFAAICIINLLIDILTSYKFFTIPISVGIINSLFCLAFITFFHSSGDVKSALIGLSVSYGLNLFMLLFIMKRYLHWKFRLIKPIKEKRVWRNFCFAQLGNFTSTASAYMPMYILSGFNAGVITALTFAQQLSSLPTNLITYQFSSVAGIKFNELFARQEKLEINRIFTETADFLHFVLTPVCFFMFIFSEQIVQVLSRFASFNGAALAYIAVFLKYLAFLIPLYVINTLTGRLFTAGHKIKEAFWYQVAFNIVLIGGMYYAVRQLGEIGYPVALIIAYTANIFVTYFIEKFYFNIVKYVEIVKKLGFILALNIGISAAIYLLTKSLNWSNPEIILIISFAAYGTILLAINHYLKLNHILLSQIQQLSQKIKIRHNKKHD